MHFTPNLTRTEWKQGFIALALSLVVLPGLLGLLPDTVSAGQRNIVYYGLNFAMAVFVFRGFLNRNLKTAIAHPFYTIYYALLGYLAHMALGELVAIAIYMLRPGFLNANDQSILTQLGSERGVFAAAIILLVPVAEECFFRGLLFRGVHDRSPVLAWVLSAGLFAAVHVAGYVGSYDPLSLVLAFLQYLPAGIALCVSYQRGGSILSPILTHMIVNFVAVYHVLR